ncbi:MAG: hypothetical protein ACQESM_00635 [Bacteroidota bacterium]
MISVWEKTMQILTKGLSINLQWIVIQDQNNNKCGIPFKTGVSLCNK